MMFTVRLENFFFLWESCFYN